MRTNSDCTLHRVEYLLVGLHGPRYAMRATRFRAHHRSFPQQAITKEDAFLEARGDGMPTNRGAETLFGILFQLQGAEDVMKPILVIIQTSRNTGADTESSTGSKNFQRDKLDTRTTSNSRRRKLQSWPSRDRQLFKPNLA